MSCLGTFQWEAILLTDAREGAAGLQGASVSETLLSGGTEY